MNVDFHAHILPKADHGSSSVEMSLNQLRKAEECGINTIFATPHFYLNRDNISSFLERRDRTFDNLTAAMTENQIDMHIIKSAEVNLQVGLTSLDNLEQLCIEGTDYMLLELPMDTVWTPWVYNSIYELRQRGIEPIIAHIDRYYDKALQGVFEQNVKTQINASSLTGFMSRRRIMKYIDNGMVHFLGSDVHTDAHQYGSYAKSQKVLKDKLYTFNRNAQKLLNI